MARREIVTLTDDIDRSEAAETVEFAIRGKAYEIDLSEDNVKRLDDALADFIDSARPRGKVIVGKRTVLPAARSTNREESQAARAWARSNGFPNVADRGRVPADVLAAYEKRAR